MNMYTLDPTKAESAAVPPPTIPGYALPSASAYAPPPPTSVSAPVPVVPSQYIPPNYQYYPYQYPQAPVAPPEIRKVSDWLPWSIVNLFLGGIILGLFPLIFSIVCRNKKQTNDLSGARTMSVLALVFNIIITLLAVASAVGIFVYFYVYSTKQVTLF